MAVLRHEGFAVTEEARTTTYVRLTVAEPSGRACKIEVARDARIRPPVRLDVGAVLHPEEIAADKVLALFGRAAPRDFVDVCALARAFAPARLLDFAREKDPGFDRRHFAAALRSVTRLTDGDFHGARAVGCGRRGTARARSRMGRRARRRRRNAVGNGAVAALARAP